jgi:flagellar biosynthetic protein FliR
MGLIPGSSTEFYVFFAVLVRVTVVLFMFPFFSTQMLPAVAKVGLALIVALLLFPAVQTSVEPMDMAPLSMGLLVLFEFLIGLVLSLMIRLFFEGVQMMGHMVGFQTGFAITNVIDPQNQIQISLMANMAYMVAMTVFLVINGHHIFITALQESFQVIPIGGTHLGDKIYHLMVDGAGDVFVIAVKIGAPAIVALLLTKVAFGLITKLIPQMNIMIVGFPLQIVIGLFFFGVSMQLLAFFITEFIGGLDALLMTAMNWMRA